MTAWDDLVTYGVAPNGIEFRLVIEGAPYEICTTEEMSGACSETGQTGKYRIPGLKREGLGFSESAYLAGAELSISINAVRIMETPAPYLNAVTEMFTGFANTKTYLSATLAVGDATMSVQSEADLVDESVYHISTEAIRITSLTGDLTPSISRAQWRTFEQTHQASVVSGPAVRPVRDGVNIWSGRRVWLYAHGPSEFGLADVGELVWRGRLADEPQLDGGDAVVWNLTIESRLAMFDQEVGTAGDAPLQLRGAYYPAGNQLEFKVDRSATASLPTVRPSDTVTVTVAAGHYESDWTLRVMIETALLDPTITGWGISFFTEMVNGRWELRVRTAAVGPRYILVYYGSQIDGSYRRGRLQEAFYGTAGLGGSRPGDAPPPDAEDVDAASEYVCMWLPDSTDADVAGHIDPGQMRRLPRSDNRSPRTAVTDAEFAANPPGRIYLTSVQNIAVGDTLLVSQPADANGDEVPPRAFYITAVDATDGYIEAYGGEAGVDKALPPGFVAAGSSCPELKIATRIGATGGITLDGFRDALIAAAPSLANNGSMPFVLSDDVADWQIAVDGAANGHPFLTSREYVFYKGARLSDVLKQEARLYGLFFYLDADFKIALRPLTIDTQEGVYTLSDEDGTILTESGFGEMKSGMDGNINTVEFSTGYDPSEDKHKGPTITVVSVEGVSESKKRRVLDIKPKSRSIVGEVTRQYAYDLSDPVRTLFGSRILHYTFTVPITYWPVLIGDTVTITSSTLPYDGARAVHDSGSGMTNRTGLVVGREWNLDEGTGRLTVLVSSLRLSGYTPSGRISSATGATTSWTLTLEANRYSPSGSVDASYFRVGDAIQIRQWDADAPTTRIGSVNSVTGNDIAVTLTTSWTGLGGGTYNLVYQGSDQADVTQLQYAFVANAARRVDNDVPVTAYLFAP